MKQLITLWMFCVLCVSMSYAQTSLFGIPEYPENQASLKSMRQDLPAEVDNSESMYFPPIYTQEHAVCNQVSVAYYLMSYELNRLRNLDASLPENQMSVYFTYNFNNGGFGWYGSNFLQTMDFAKRLGIPSRTLFGDDDHMDTITWMSGVQKYKSAMGNRAKAYYAIDLSDAEGIAKLKAWLYDHLSGNESGGLAVIMGGYNNLGTLPESSVYAGEKVLYRWGYIASHARVIVGYNDSIRYDLNGDGQFTTDVDINNDGLIDIRDSEFGAFKYSESYGTETGNDGFYWAMYSTFADVPANGGILNSEAYVMIPYESYQPKLIAEIELSNNLRNQLQIGIGLSKGDNLNQIEQHFYYPMINFQGGPRPMQGFNVAGADDFAYALDISNILSFVEAGETFRLHLLLNLASTSNPGNGVIHSFKVLDATGDNEIVYADNASISIVQYQENPMFVDLSLDFDKLSMQTDSLNYSENNEFFQQQLICSGGQAPYNWSLQHDWKMEVEEHGFVLDENAESIVDVESLDKDIAVNLPFDFPFGYGSVEAVSVSPYGYIVLGGDREMGIYFRDYLRPMIENTLVIAPLPRDNTEINLENGDGIWMDSSEDVVHFYWKVSEESQSDMHAEYSVSLYPDGQIVFHYGQVQLSASAGRYYGLSLGDQMSLKFFDVNAYPGENAVLRFIPQTNANIDLSQSGFLSGSIDTTVNKYLKVRVEDALGQYIVHDFLKKDSSEVVIPSFETGIFPNPCRSGFRFISNDEKIYSMEIIDLQGRIVHQATIQNNQYVNVAKFRKSHYLVKLKSESGDKQVFPLIIY